MTRIVEVEENGSITLTPDMLGKPKPHTRFLIESNGHNIKLRLENGTRSRKANTPRRSLPDWELEQDALANELAAIWPPETSALDAIADVRR